MAPGLPLLFSFLALFFSPGPIPPAEIPRLQTEKNVGLAAVEEGNLAEARRRFEALRRLAPQEPLGWADGAVVAMREKNLAGAKTLLAQALRLAPGDGRVLALQATLEELEGNFPAAVEAAEKAAAASPRDLVSRWAAARVLSEKIPNGRPRALGLLSAALQSAPANLFLLARLFELELQGAGADRSKPAAAFEKLEHALEAETRSDAKLARYLSETKAALDSGDAVAASLKFRIVENLLRVLPRYQQARRDVDPAVVGLPLEDWSTALAAAVRARPRGVPVRFVERSTPGLGALERLSAVRAGGRDGRDLVFAGESGIAVALSRDSYRTGPPLPGSIARDVAVADVAGSGQLDLVTPNGLWIGGRESRKVPFSGGEHLLPFDYDNDGDLDLYLTSPSGDRLWRNNLDGTWTDATATALPPGVASGAVCAADFDRDGDVDLVLARASGGLLLLDNLRGGRFAEREAGLPKTGAFRGVAAADMNADGRPDLVWTTPTSAFVALNRGDGTFLPAREIAAGGEPLLFDFDNDGALDLFLASPKGSSLWRNDGAGNFQRVEGAFPPAIAAESVDFDGDGDLDLVLVTPEGKALLLENQGGNANGWIDVALEGLPTGSAKVNRFGYGSEVEVKAGQLYAFRTVSRPVTHVGVGPARKADVLRVIWTNGIPQNRLSPPVQTLVTEVQQLKGSCPFLYVFDGRRWSFVTDALGRAPAGLLYDGVHQAPADTREWLLVPGEKLAAGPDGKLLLDFTEELWETAYFDLAELEAVDHPKGTQIVPNEKMVPPPFPEKTLFTISHPFTPRVTDERGRDRTQEIAREDGTFLAGFSPTRYQGIVEPHDLILQMPEARSGKRVMLYLTGWIFYADTSISVSLSQGSRPEKPSGPTLEVPDGHGGWRVAMPSMGYPAGKTKTVPVDLTGLLDPADPRVRIRTNLAIAWDRICYTVGEEPAPIRRARLPLSAARLFVRGFSRMTRDSPDGPQVFVHDDVDTSPRWADMAGLYTRLGDVRELLNSVDDRYVVMKGGDAVRLEFDGSALPPPPAGWVRDWIVILDGWDKDADKNTVAGQTVEPLPFHGMDDARYGDPSQRYPQDDEHRRFREEYLTRRGGPEEFIDALRNAR